MWGVSGRNFDTKGGRNNGYYSICKYGGDRKEYRQDAGRCRHVREGCAESVRLHHTAGGLQVPTIDNLVILAALFGVGLDDLVAIDDEAMVRCG